MPGAYPKQGYLLEDFHIFSLKDQSQKFYPYHYHDFYKLLIFHKGNVSYHVEGKEYALRPGDVILLNPGEIHRAIIHDDSVYSRLIIYLSAGFFRSYQDESDGSIRNCYRTAELKHSHLIRFSGESAVLMNRLAKELEATIQENGFAASLMQRIKILEYLIHLNRWMLRDEKSFVPANTANPTVLGIMEYINQHLTEDLSSETIASALFLNPSYMMHLFKAETGYTIGRYMTEKRLFLTHQYMNAGDAVTDACMKSGFQSYHAFYHAYRKKYGKAPTK